MKQLTWFVLLALTFAWCAGQQLHVGSSCTLTDGRAGHCRKLKECQEALQELKQKTPTTCFFDKFEPIVCCPKPAGSISSRKCEEYSQYVFIEEVLSWVPGAPRVNRSRCAAVDAGAILVIGGQKAVPREFPHMALIGYGEKNSISWGCGGSLISELYVLTAAHCVSYRGTPAKWVLLGDLDIKSSEDDAQPQLIGVSTPVLEPGFKPGYRYNDIALLRLAKAAELNDFVRPACLHASRNIDITAGIASGWGRTSNDNATLSDILMKVELPFRKTQECTEVYSELRDKNRTRSGFDDETMLCIGDPSRPKDTCKGDSGAPFQTVLAKPFCMYDIIGVTSFGRSYCGTTVPAVYTRVSTFVPWIETVVWPND